MSAVGGGRASAATAAPHCIMHAAPPLLARQLVTHLQVGSAAGARQRRCPLGSHNAFYLLYVLYSVRHLDNVICNDAMKDIESFTSDILSCCVRAGLECASSAIAGWRSPRANDSSVSGGAAQRQTMEFS